MLYEGPLADEDSLFEAESQAADVAYEHSLKIAPDDFVVNVSAQVVEDVPANIPRALLPEFITEIILSQSPQIGKIRNLRVL